MRIIQEECIPLMVESIEDESTNESREPSIHEIEHRLQDIRIGHSEVKKKRGFFSSLLKPYRTPLKHVSRPLSMPSSMAAILGRGGDSASVGRSKSYESRIAKLQTEKYISNGTAPLISVEHMD